jgi:subtilase family serine protease
MKSKLAIAFVFTVGAVFLIASSLLIYPAGAASGRGTVHFKSRVRNVGEVPNQVATSAYLGSLPPDKEIRMLISFQPRNQVELNQLEADLYNPSSPRYHQWLTAEEFGKRFGRSEEEFKMAAAWLRSQGLNVDRTYSNHLAIGFTGTVGTVERALNVQMGQYWDSLSNRSFYSNSQAPTLPSKIEAITIHLTGLNNALIYHRPLRSIERIDPATKQAGKKESKGGLRTDGIYQGQTFMGPKDFATVYNFAPLSSADFQGQGQSIGIIMDSDVLDSDMASYRSQFGLPAANLQRLVLPGLSNPGITTDGEVEADLDTQSISGVAPLAEIDLITIPELDTVSVETAEEDVVSLGTIHVVNESFGGCEIGGFSSAEENLFTQAATQGIGFFAAAGDSGAVCGGGPGPAEIVCPACYPNVTSVGGTQIAATFDSSGNLTQKLSETVWNEPPGVQIDCSGKSVGGGAGGGGVSQIVSIPSYQQSAQGFAGGVPSGTTRSVPDVAALAGAPFTLIFSEGAAGLVGGTSLSTPLWSGMMGLINQYEGTAQGLPNSVLYKLAVNQYKNGGPQVFVDITSGNNGISPMLPCLPTGVAGYSASTGYDSVSGLGVPDAYALAQGFGPSSGGCTFSLSSSSQSFQSSGGSGNVDVNATSSCAWTASSNTSWITIASGASGTGAGTVNYSVAENSGGTRRTGTLSIAGETFTVSQVSSSGASGSVELSVDDGNFEDAIGSTSGGVQYGVNRLTPSTYPATVSQLNLYFPANSGITPGQSINLVVAANPSGGDNIDGLTFQSTAATIGTLGQFDLYTVPNVTIDSGDFVVGFQITTSSGSVYPYAISTDPPLAGRSYVSTDGTSFFVIDTLQPSLAGNFGMRAEVTEGGGSSGGGGKSTPVVSNLSADLEGNVLTLIGTGTDSGASMTQLEVTLQDATNQTVDDTGVISANFGLGATSNFLYQFTNMASFPTAVTATVVIVDSQGNRSTPVSANFGSGDPGGPHIGNVTMNSAGMVITGGTFASGIQLEVNGQLVAPPLSIKVKGGGVKLKITGKARNLNIVSGPNRIQLVAGSLKSNIFVFVE